MWRRSPDWRMRSISDDGRDTRTLLERGPLGSGGMRNVTGPHTEAGNLEGKCSSRRLQQTFSVSQVWRVPLAHRRPARGHRLASSDPLRPSCIRRTTLCRSSHGTPARSRCALVASVATGGLVALGWGGRLWACGALGRSRWSRRRAGRAAFAAQPLLSSLSASRVPALRGRRPAPAAPGCAPALPVHGPAGRPPAAHLTVERTAKAAASPCLNPSKVVVSARRRHVAGKAAALWRRAATPLVPLGGLAPRTPAPPAERLAARRSADRSARRRSSLAPARLPRAVLPPPRPGGQAMRSAHGGAAPCPRWGAARP